jgi:hypothetical protein
MKKATGGKVLKPSDETLGDSSQTLIFVNFLRTLEFIHYLDNSQENFPTDPTIIYFG